MKKDTTKQIFSFLANDILMLKESLSKINDRLDELDEALGFQNGSINTLEMTVKKLSHNFHEEQRIDPYIVNTNRPNWLNKTVDEIDKRDLERALEELTPKNVTDGLNRLYTKADGGRTWLDDVNDKVDQIVLEKKIRERIIARLEEEAEKITCTCGEICAAYDNGFEDAIYTIRNM
jgi:tetrahydromethanopterin S-methyltransferase subunit G